MSGECTSSKTESILVMTLLHSLKRRAAVREGTLSRPKDFDVLSKVL